MAESTGEEGLSDAAGTEEEDILGTLEEAEVEEVADAIPVEGDGGIPIEVLEGVGLLEAGPVETGGEVLSLAAVDLVLEREFEEVQGSERSFPAWAARSGRVGAMPESLRRLSTALRLGLTSVMIDLRGLGVSEAAPRALEPRLEGDDLGLGIGPKGQGELVQVLKQDGLDPKDVDELEGQGPAAGSIYAVPSVLGAQAEELLGLTELGPGDGSTGQFGHEPARVGPLTLSLADQPLRIAERVGGEFSGIVVVICGPAAGGLSGTRLDQGAVYVDPHEL
jgi:hypothetical protein